MHQLGDTAYTVLPGCAPLCGACCLRWSPVDLGDRTSPSRRKCEHSSQPALVRGAPISSMSKLHRPGALRRPDDGVEMSKRRNCRTLAFKSNL